MNYNKKTLIIRAQHGAENHYFLMSRKSAQDRELSFEARGMLAYILSKPDTWQINIDDLRQKDCGRDKVYKTLKELITSRYAERIITRDTNHRVVNVDYLVHEEPLPEKPDTDLPDTENQDSKENTEVDTTDKDCMDTTGEKPKAPRKADPIFDAVALRFYGIADSAQVNGAGSRVAKSKKAIKEVAPEVTPKDIDAFCDFYKLKYPHADLPRDGEKIKVHWLAWQQVSEAVSPSWEKDTDEASLW